MAWLRYFGHLDAKMTGAGADGGIDVTASTAVAQVKARRLEKASRPDVQRLIGASGRGDSRDLFFFAWSGYTADALTWAEREGVAAFEFALDGGITPRTERARVVQRAALDLPEPMPIPEPGRGAATAGGGGCLIMFILLVAALSVIPLSL